MNYLLLALLAISVIVSILVLILFIIFLGLWMKNLTSLVLPGLGVIVATPLVLLMLLVVEIIMVLISAHLVRLIPIARLLFGGVK